MSNDVRHPGPVIEPAEPIYPDALERQDTHAEPHREIGPIREPAKPLPNEDDTSQESPVESELARRSVWRIVGYFALALLASFGIWHWSGVLGELWRNQIWLAALLSTLTVGFAIALGRALFIEHAAAQRVDQLPKLKQQVESALQSDRLIELQSALAPAISSLRDREPDLIAGFEAACTDQDQAADFAKRFDNLVLSELDKAAEDEINRHAILTGGAVAVLPHPALDAIVVLWRASKLIRRIGEIYGLQPTGLSSVRLMKLAITNAILAAGLDTAGEAIGAKLGTQALGAAAEAAVIILRMRRLGETTRRLCRPIPLPP